MIIARLCANGDLIHIMASVVGGYHKVFWKKLFSLIKFITIPLGKSINKFAFRQDVVLLHSQ